MKQIQHYVSLFVLVPTLATQSAMVVGSSAKSDWEAKKQELDAACEVVREAHLSVDRAEYVDECVAKKQKENRAACERFYSDWGNQSGSRAPLYYDLPECEIAFAHRQSQRSGSR